MEGAGHEGVVLHGVAEHDELAGADALLIGGELGGALDDAGHLEGGVHVDAGPRAAHVHRGADAVGGGERRGDGVHELVVGPGGAFVHERREAADEIDAHLLAGAVHGHGHGREVVGGHRGADLRDGGDRDALIHDGDAELALELLGGGYELLGGRGHAVVNLGRQRIHIGVDAAAQVDAQRDSADVQVLLGHHGQGLGNFGRGDLHGGSSLATVGRARVRAPVIVLAQSTKSWSPPPLYGCGRARLSVTIRNVRFEGTGIGFLPPGHPCYTDSHQGQPISAQ